MNEGERPEGSPTAEEMLKIIGESGATPEDRAGEFQKALNEGQVNLMMSEDSEDVLVDDGTARLMLIRDAQAGPGVFGFAAQDGGGFTGIFCDRAGWEQMKAKVEKFLAGLT